MLIDGGTALEAATEATIVLEDAGETNAGYGSNLVSTRIMVYNGHLITATLGESRLSENF